jgi:pimeloyl-ACP methyl ester carboxylesterase
MRRYWALGFFVLLALTIAAYGGASWYLWAQQRELVFAPTRDVTRTPADVQLQYEDVRIAVGARDPATLCGWWLQSADAAAATVLYLHGNDLNIGGNVDHVAALHRIGFSVLVVDHRGYGKCEGAFPSESQVYDDAEAAWDFLIRQRHVDPGRAFIYGHSLGGAVAIELALRRPEAAGLIVESAFTSMPDIAKTRYWMFPVDWLLNQRFDAEGRTAAQGKVDAAWIARALKMPFFSLPPPKSLDRNDFELLKLGDVPPEDGAATLTAFTAASIARAREHFPHAPKGWIVSGGGRHNPVLMDELRRRLGGEVLSAEDAGWRGDFIEAEAFAYLAARSVKGLPLSLPSTTGVPHPMPGGRLHRPAS